MAALDHVPQPAVLGLAAIGAGYALFKFGSFVRLLLSLFVLPGASLSKFGDKGSWAVITGASDGIGKEYALQLARKGFNVVLVSRTESKLRSLAAEIEATHKVQTRIHAMDFAANNDADFTALSQLIADLDVAILINNVGFSHSIPVPFLQTPADEMRDIININCLGTLKATRAVAPKLVARRRGLVLTMASFGGVMPTPLLATYSGSKAFLQHWSTALGAELAPAGVTVQLVQSYLVTSAMSKIRRASATIPTPKAFVKAALSKIGRSGGAQGVAYTSTPFWSHGIMHWAIGSFVGIMNGVTLKFNRDMHESIRKRALRKAEREGKKVA
ncbi:uncharacterized protein J3D65DRAFT_612646 [Phyllosticta citribraziliensis]|uniref:Very-long-chain 3-oxoacyl-CoA reductase n=1 Tax=Phyllosticta citribraziliensis TaxID=989973 RepID=A0ABR1M3D8_9PEZI